MVESHRHLWLVQELALEYEIASLLISIFTPPVVEWKRCSRHI